MNLIDADKYPCAGCEKQYCYESCKAFWKWLETPEDVQIVNRAYWLVELGEVCCSNCGATPRDEKWLNGKYHYPDYCHACGSQMNSVLEGSKTRHD